MIINPPVSKPNSSNWRSRGEDTANEFYSGGIKENCKWCNDVKENKPADLIDPGTEGTKD